MSQPGGKGFLNNKLMIGFFTLVFIPMVIAVINNLYEHYCINLGNPFCIRTEATPIPSVTPLPSGYQLAFSSNRDGNFEIYVTDIDGSNVKRLTDNPGNDWAPVWSPDGNKIAFTSNRDGDDEIYVMNADGTGVQQLTFNSAYDCCPDWSPDGSKIIFNSNLPDGDQDIYAVDAGGLSAPINLTDAPGDDWGPEWSLDGTKILFDARRDGQAEVYIMDADGTNQTRLTSLFSAEGGADWGPNGLIVFHSDQSVAGDFEIFMMFADGTGFANITNHSADDMFASWSPDGKFIVFTSNRDGNNELYVMEYTGNNPVNITNHSADDTAGAWRPMP